MRVGLLTIEQKTSLEGQWFQPHCYFNPIQDAQDNWIITLQEIQGNTNPNFTWVSSIPLIDYIEKESPNLLS